MKIVLLGGSSPSTPALLGFLAGCPELPPLEVVLLSRSEVSLCPIAHASEALIGDRPIRISAVPLDHCWGESLEGADIVLLQVRIGGYQARQNYESFPLAFGICGDQDLGPGALANAWQSWPQLEPFFREVAARAPRAIMLVLSSPVGLIVRLGLLSAPRMNIAGICELPWSTLRHIVSTLNVPTDQVTFSYCGLHHLGWFYRMRLGSRDLVQEYASAVQDRSEFPSSDLIRSFSAIPTRYAELHFAQGRVVANQRKAPGARSAYLAKYRKDAQRVFARGSVDEIEAMLLRRAAPWYSEAIGPLICALAGVKVDQPFFLSRPNATMIDGMRNDDVLEMAYQAREGTVIGPLIQLPIPNKILAFIQQFVEAERRAAAAIWMRDPQMMEDAVNAHPWIADKGEASANIIAKIL